MSVHREGVEPNSVDGPDHHHHDHIAHDYTLHMNWQFLNLIQYYIIIVRQLLAAGLHLFYSLLVAVIHTSILLSYLEVRYLLIVHCCTAHRCIHHMNHHIFWLGMSVNLCAGEKWELVCCMFPSFGAGCSTVTPSSWSQSFKRGFPKITQSFTILEKVPTTY